MEIGTQRLYGPWLGFNFAREMTRRDMARVCAEFGEAAALAVECGVDALELHLGHGCEHSNGPPPRCRLTRTVAATTLSSDTDRCCHHAVV